MLFIIHNNELFHLLIIHRSGQVNFVIQFAFYFNMKNSTNDAIGKFVQFIIRFQ